MGDPDSADEPARKGGAPTRSIVPFGEWIPFREVLLPMIPQLGYVGAQSVRGREPGVLPVRLGEGRPMTVGVLICFDLAFDQVVYGTGSRRR